LANIEWPYLADFHPRSSGFMVHRSNQSSYGRLVLLFLALGTAQTAAAASLYWSSSSSTTWDNGTTQDWATVSGGPYNASAWSNGSDAHFQGMVGTVNVSGSIASVNSLNFDVSGYTVSSGTINLTGAGGPINVVSGGSATINSALSGSVGLTESSAGVLTLAGVNNYTGITTINGGTLKLGANNALPSTTVVTIGQGDGNNATWDLNGFSQTIGGLALNT